MANQPAGEARWIVRVLTAAASAFLLVAPLGVPALAATPVPKSALPAPSPSVTSPASAASPAEGAGAAGGPATVGADGRPRVHAVVLVDESNSETPGTVRQEADAAGLIATSQQLDKDSKVAVVGFGTDDFPEVSRQQHGATDEVCPLATVGSAGFRTCLASLHRRTEEEGNGTDHAAALTKALDILEAAKDPGFFNVVFLLTDGGLRVDNVQRYGTRLPDQQAREQERGTAAMNETATVIAPRARALGAQIWPVGFGTVLNRDWMRRLPGFGAGTSQNCQKVPVAAPAASYANTAADIALSLDRALANASCMGFDTDQDNGGPGSPVTLSLSIPAIASSATINALKRDPGIKVEYIDPRGHSVRGSGSQDGSFFTLNNSAANSESLFVTSPYPGTWKIRFTWPANARAQTVQADLSWIGQLSSTVRLTPASPKPGERATVHITLQTSRNEPVNPRDLTGLVFDAQLTGDGFAPVPVPLADNGQGGDDNAGDGGYAGQITVPATASGLLSVTGRIMGSGLRGTVQHATYRIPGRSGGGAVVELRPPGHVHRGATVSGTLRADNPTGSPRQIELRPDGLAGVGVSPSTVTVPAGASGFAQALKLSVASDTGYGRRTGVVRVSDTTEGSPGSGSGVVLTEEPVSFEVEAPPGTLEKIWPFLLIAAVVLLLAIVAALLARARWRRAVNVSDLQAFAARSDGTTADLPASQMWASAFRFVINDVPGQFSLVLAGAGEGGAYTVRRAKHGQLTISTPAGETRTVSAGARVPAGNGGQLWIADRRVGSTASSQGTGGVGADAFGNPISGGTAVDAFGNPIPGGADPNGNPFDSNPFDGNQYGGDQYGGGPYGGQYGDDPWATIPGPNPPGPGPAPSGFGGNGQYGANGPFGAGQPAGGGGYGPPPGYGSAAHDPGHVAPGGGDEYGTISEAPTLQPGGVPRRPSPAPPTPPAPPSSDPWNETQF
ncbi:putative von Willebrand factor type A [Frankia sp. AiPs1]|uniref:vWA domain-containing protein n=1 Tax=Frankia sp. AiPa1 TaxID=573492 RepID=UPI00202AE078|nr:VWA domain-containing protein [Frankia sp. AiPa1]MCL9760504.1 VWA domain-containing protein [Frankia sp. AiPa1]